MRRRNEVETAETAPRCRDGVLRRMRWSWLERAAGPRSAVAAAVAPRARACPIFVCIHQPESQDRGEGTLKITKFGDQMISWARPRSEASG